MVLRTAWVYAAEGNNFVRTMLRSRRLDHPLSLLYMDVDDLKQVNDRFGHAAGDETLRAVGHAVRHCSRDGTDVRSPLLRTVQSPGRST